MMGIKHNAKGQQTHWLWLPLEFWTIVVIGLVLLAISGVI